MGDLTHTHVEATRIQQTRREQTQWNHVKTFLTVIALSSTYFCQLTLLVGAGLLSRPIVAVVGGASLAAWPTAIMGLMVAALSPVTAQMADYWGRKWFLVILTSFGCVGTIIVSRTTSFEMAIAGFTVASLSCVSQPLLHAVVSEVLPRKHRSWAQTCVNIAVAVGGIYGLLVGGALTASNPEGFRTYFYISAGFYAAVSLACAFLYNPPPREAQTISIGEKLASLDWVGYSLVVFGVTLLCVGLAWAENPYPWRSAHVLGPFLVGATLLIVLGIYEWKGKTDGLFHHHLFHNRNFAITLLASYIEGSGAFATNYFVPFQLSVMQPQMDTFRIGLCYSITYFSFVFCAFGVGYFIYKTKSIRIPILVGNSLLLLFYILVATTNTSTPEANFWGFMVFLGCGLGMLLITLVVAAQLSTPPELIAIASGLVLSIRSLGASTGLVIYQAVFSAGLSSNLAPKIAGAVLPLGLPETSLGPLIGALTSGMPDAVASVPDVTPEIIGAAAHALQDAYGLAFSYVWATAAAFTFVALVAAAFLKDPKDQFTAVVDAPLDIVEVVPDDEMGTEDKATTNYSESR